MIIYKKKKNIIQLTIIKYSSLRVFTTKFNKFVIPTLMGITNLKINL